MRKFVQVTKCVPVLNITAIGEAKTCSSGVDAKPSSIFTALLCGAAFRNKVTWHFPLPKNMVTDNIHHDTLDFTFSYLEEKII